MGGIPRRPIGRGLFKCGVASGDSFQIYGADGTPILFDHVLNCDGPDPREALSRLRRFRFFEDLRQNCDRAVNILL